MEGQTDAADGDRNPFPRRRRLVFVLLGAIAFALLLGVLFGLTSLETARVAITAIAVVAVSEWTEKWMEQLAGRSAVLHGLVLFAFGVAAAVLFTLSIGEKPVGIEVVAGFIVLVSARKRGKQRTEDNDGVVSAPVDSQNDGRRWRTGSP